MEAFQWKKDHQWDFETLKAELSRPPASGLPNLDKSFTLYIHEKCGTVLGLLIQKLRPTQRPVAYFSNQLASVALACPSCP